MVFGPSAAPRGGIDEVYFIFCYRFLDLELHWMMGEGVDLFIGSLGNESVCLISVDYRLCGLSRFYGYVGSGGFFYIYI